MKKICLCFLMCIMICICSSCEKRFKFSDESILINGIDNGYFGFEINGERYFDLPDGHYAISIDDSSVNKKGIVYIYIPSEDPNVELEPKYSYALTTKKSYKITVRSKEYLKFDKNITLIIEKIG